MEECGLFFSCMPSNPWSCTKLIWNNNWKWTRTISSCEIPWAHNPLDRRDWTHLKWKSWYLVITRGNLPQVIFTNQMNQTCWAKARISGLQQRDLNETFPWERSNFEKAWINGAAVCAFRIKEIRVVTLCLQSVTRTLCGQTEWCAEDSTAALKCVNVDESTMPQWTPIFCCCVEPPTQAWQSTSWKVKVLLDLLLPNQASGPHQMLW